MPCTTSLRSAIRSATYQLIRRSQMLSTRLLSCCTFAQWSCCKVEVTVAKDNPLFPEINPYWRPTLTIAASSCFSAMNFQFWPISSFLWIVSLPSSPHTVISKYSLIRKPYFWSWLSGYSQALWPSGSMKVRPNSLYTFIMVRSGLCNFYYDENIQFLTFTSSELCGKIGWYGDFLKNSAIVAIVMVLDIITVTKVRYLSKKVIDW